MSEKCNIRVPWKWLKSALIKKKGNLNSASQNEMIFQMTLDIYKCFLIVNHNYIKILEFDWSSAGLISAVIVQLHTSCACNWTVVRVMPE